MFVQKPIFWLWCDAVNPFFHSANVPVRLCCFPALVRIVKFYVDAFWKVCQEVILAMRRFCFFRIQLPVK